jgi:hypothetical protein
VELEDVVKGTKRMEAEVRRPGVGPVQWRFFWPPTSTSEAAVTGKNNTTKQGILKMYFDIMS